MARVRTLLAWAIDVLQAAGCDTPRLDAEVLLAHTLGRERSWLYAHREALLPTEHRQQFAALIRRRAQREPVAYLTGQRAFFGLTFAVSPAVLIPRPETELLVEAALALPLPPGPLIVDVGTGSGCIAVSLAVHHPQARLLAGDLSAAALAVARQNARRHHVADRITFLQTDLLAGIAGPVDLIVSNPPYISKQEMVEIAAIAPEIDRYEPRMALTDEAAGLTYVERLLASAPTRLRAGGVLLIELGATQGPAALRLAQRLAPATRSEIRPDLAGRDRLLVARF